jgi:CheY-like chemotaxis protein
MAVRVLIADSSGITRDIMRNHLECGGCQVIAETETVAQTITLDIGLRAANGLEALSLFRMIRREAPDTSVVIVSASQAPDDQRVYLKEGALECIVEPFDSYGLERMWRRLSDIYPELRRRDEAASGR